MVTEQFIAGAKQGLMEIRNATYDAETALDTQNVGDLSRAITRLLGSTSTTTMLILAKIVYEQSDAEVTVKECVITTLTRRGKGTTPDSPIRCITEVWDAQTGEKIAEKDMLLHYDRLTDNYKFEA
ncbi:MAG: hypothetical protein MUO61_03390 [Dehalococcoidia bacterium]|nr:hypothetical protein [Dehalococcoidia bacterium]